MQEMRKCERMQKLDLIISNNGVMATAHVATEESVRGNSGGMDRVESVQILITCIGVLTFMFG